MDLREPEDIAITGGDGIERKFILSKMTAWDGLEIMARLPTSIISGSIPKIGDWEVVRKLQLQIMKYVAVDINGTPLPLSTQVLIDNHCGDWECFAKLLKAEVAYNNSFFRNATPSDLFAEAFRVALAKISETLTQSSERSSLTEKQPSMN